MTRSTAGSVCVAAIVAVAWMSAPAIAGPQEADGLRKRIASLEAGQKAILRELQDIKALLQNRPAPPEATAPGVAAPPMNLDLTIAGAATRGRADAKLVVVEFSDFQCPFCGRYARETMGRSSAIMSTPERPRYVFVNFPIEKIHPLALRAAEAAECARAQGKFWELHSRLYANQQALAEADLVMTAQAVRLNMPAFQQCFASQLTAPVRIRQDLAEGARAGITGTPAFFMGTMTKDGKVHVLRKLFGAQPYAAFRTAIDGLLASPELTK